MILEAPEPATLHLFGLGMDVLGAALLFWWGPPAPRNLRDGTRFLAFRSDDETERLQIARRALWERVASWAGFLLLVIGFLLQFLSAWLLR